MQPHKPDSNKPGPKLLYTLNIQPLILYVISFSTINNKLIICDNLNNLRENSPIHFQNKYLDH